MADIDGVDPCRVALEQHLGEAAGGGAEIKAGLAGRIDAAGFEASDQFQRGARNIGGGGIVQCNDVVRPDLLVGLLRDDAVHRHRAAQHGVAGAGPALQQAAGFQCLIEPDALAHDAISFRILPMAVSLASP